MKYFILPFLFFHLTVGSWGQSKMPASLASMLTITRGEFSQPRFLYGIKPMPGAKDSKLDVVFRPFKMVYEIGYVKKAAAIPEPSLFVGFYGFDFPVISRLDTLWSRPADTAIQPCAHNLLADVFVNSYESFETPDPESCKLLIFDLAKNSKLAELISTIAPVPASAKGLFYLFWDTRIQPSLPDGFSGSGMIEMDVTNPIKIPNSKITLAQAKPVPPPAPVIKEPPVKKIPEQTVKPKEPAPAQKTKQETIEKKQTQDIAKKPEPKTQPPVKTEPVKPMNPAVAFIHAPEISKSLYPDLWEFAVKQTPSLDKNDITLKLSKRNDSLIAFSKSLKQATNIYPLPFKSCPVSLRPAENSFPVELTAVAVKANLTQNLRSVDFGYKGQELFFSDDKTNVVLQIPDCFSNRQELKGNWDTEAKLSWKSGQKSDADTLFVNLEKAPVRLTIVDEKTNSPVNGCIVTVRVKGKIVNSLRINSTADIQGLYRLESVYQLSIQHDDYYPKSPFLTRKDFDAGKTIILSSQPAYDLFFIAPVPEMKNQIITSVEQKFESVTRLKQPFYLFVSNTDRPLITSDEKSVGGIIDKIPQLFDDAPNLITDFNRINKAVLSKAPPPNTLVNLNFYMSKEVFESQGKAFIDKVVHPFKDIFKVKYWVNIYLDTEITQQFVDANNKDDKTPNKMYHFFSLSNE